MTTSLTSPTDPGYRQVERLMSRMTGDEKHSASATSTLDVLWVLYDRILRIDPRGHDDDARDRFLLSKGHGPMAYYAILAAKGFFDPELLRGWCRHDSPLGLHPDRNLVPRRRDLVRLARPRTAAGRRHRARASRTDIGGGSSASSVTPNSTRAATTRRSPGRRARALPDALTVIVIDNQSSTLTWPGGIAKRFDVEGWHTERSTAATTARSRPR